MICQSSKAFLWDFEDLLLNDGCTGIAVLNPSIPQEVQFDEHKLLIVYGNPLASFEQLLSDHDVWCDDDMKFITEAEHVFILRAINITISSKNSKHASAWIARLTNRLNDRSVRVLPMSLATCSARKSGRRELGWQ